MRPDIPKISVLIITYKQEELIKRAIESLLEQREYIYEICISDDCSPDNTWDVITEYSNKYPGLFKISRHTSNIGIFENIESTWLMPSGDLIYNLSGDDECGKGWFKKVIDYILDNNIKYTNERVCFYGDYKCCYPSGDSFVFSNQLIKSGISPVRLSMRGLIGNRSAVYSKAVLEAFVKVSIGKSHIAESAIDLQLQLFSEKTYYLPYVGNIYHTRIGVSSNLSKELMIEREGIPMYALRILKDNGYVPCKADVNYLEYITLRSKQHKDWPLLHFFYIFNAFLRSIDYRVFPIRKRLNRLLFAICLRLPHRKKMMWII